MIGRWVGGGRCREQPHTAFPGEGGGQALPPAGCSDVSTYRVLCCLCASMSSSVMQT